jgi:GTP-binding protein
MEHCLKSIEDEVPFLKHCPKIFMSAKTGRNVESIFDEVKKVYADSKKRITTHQLNKFIGLCLQKNHPPMLNGKRLRIYYMAQVDIQPPKFVLFVNFPNLMVESYRKYIYNQFRDAYSFAGLPLRIFLKGKTKKNLEAHSKDLGEIQDSRRIAAMAHAQHDNPPQESYEEDFDEGDDEDFDMDFPGSENWTDESLKGPHN